MTHQTFPKPAKGSALRARKAERAKIEAHEDAEKAKVRKRDKACRWPGCDCKKLALRLEVAHLDDKGMGGDHGLRTVADRMMLLCFEKHQGRPSLHSGDLKIEPQTDRGTDDCCDFFIRDETSSTGWRCVGSERYIGMSETRGA